MFVEMFTSVDLGGGGPIQKSVSPSRGAVELCVRFLLEFCVSKLQLLHCLHLPLSHLAFNLSMTPYPDAPH